VVGGAKYVFLLRVFGFSVQKDVKRPIIQHWVNGGGGEGGGRSQSTLKTVAIKINLNKPLNLKSGKDRKDT
jgi:hypothetical protein